MNLGQGFQESERGDESQGTCYFQDLDSREYHHKNGSDMEHLGEEQCGTNENEGQGELFLPQV